MFLGEFTHTIDDKGRLTLPAKYRNELTLGVVVTRGLDHCLLIYPQAEWDKIAAKIADLPLTKADARTFSRFIFSGANDCEPDKQGRILLPNYLRTYAELDGEVVLLGAGSHLEAWNPTRWAEARANLEANGQETAERLSELGLL